MILNWYITWANLWINHFYLIGFLAFGLWKEAECDQGKNLLCGIR